MALTVRTAKTLADFTSVARLATALAAYHGDNFTPSADKLYADRDWCHTILATVDGVDVGYVSCFKGYDCHITNRFVEVQTLFVDEAYRGKKIGFALMHAAFAYGEDEGAEMFKIGVRKTNPTALAFYRQIGFTFAEENLSLRGKRKR